jgi:hypothetical protein
MGKSRFEGMETALRELDNVSRTNVEGKVRIDQFRAELENIDADTKQRIEEIKATPIDKELLRKQAENELSTRLKQNKRVCDSVVESAEQDIKQAEADAEQAYRQAKLDIERCKSNIALLKESAVEKKDRADIEAKQEHDKVLSSIDNTEKTLSLRVQKEEAAGKKRRQEIEIQLRSLEARDKIVEEQKRGWRKFYDDVVEISKQPQPQ